MTEDFSDRRAAQAAGGAISLQTSPDDETISEENDEENPKLSEKPEKKGSSTLDNTFDSLKSPLIDDDDDSPELELEF